MINKNKNNNGMEFIRFGNLNPVKQMAYDKTFSDFHKPPERFGIYAFPKGIKDSFLLGKSYYSPQMHKIISIYNNNTPLKKGERIVLRSPSKPEQLIVKFKTPHAFFLHNDKLIWHHLKNCEEIIATHGQWFLSTVKDFKKALNKDQVVNYYTASTQYHTTPSQEHIEIFYNGKIT